MDFLLHSLGDALRLIAAFDRDLLGIVATTLRVAVASTAIAALLALPPALLIARREFPGKPLVLSLLRSAMAIPTVLIGLLVYAFIARNAPLGGMRLLFTPAAIVIGQVLLILPLITALAHAALQQRAALVYEEARLLGASPRAASWQVLVESRLGVTTAVAAGFGRVISEVGIALMLGGNIRGSTRTITTAITLETSQGNFARAFALGLVLLALVVLIHLFLRLRNEARAA
ncbi:MAG: ABC transporter permease [Candidatus Eisenbacteria bacterium]|uniref:ABC transporter permease n=1 Tax=Eiseniibacteriota bacterium TaxID=2212470 RepID=A0A938BMF6_UNCEI|nr:ABC transporter permease [Candidatus Eisenbacteria bacterium]